MLKSVRTWMLLYQTTIAFAILAAILAMGFLCSCSTTQATRTQETMPDGTTKTTLTLNRLESKARIGGDSIETKNASWVDRLFKLPPLSLFQVGPGGAAPAP